MGSKLKFAFAYFILSRRKKKLNNLIDKNLKFETLNNCLCQQQRSI